MTHKNHTVYKQNQKTNLGTGGNSSRDTESRALAACAVRLEDAKQALASEPKSKLFLKNYGDAIRHNQRLWTIFQIALTDPANPLPQDLKITLLNLARYVDKTSFGAIRKFNPDLVDSLIDINRIIAAGLSKQQASPPPLPQPPVGHGDISGSLMTTA